MIAPLRRTVVVFAGGGTGGHLYPGLAVARALPAVEPVFLVPDDRGDLERVGGEFRTVPVPCPRPGAGPLLYPARLAAAVARTRRVLRSFPASAVVGLGGYGCVPACFAARTLRIPLYLMECNAVPGRATRLLARLARGIGLGDEAALPLLPRSADCRVTGTPLRAEVGLRSDPVDFGLEPGLPTLLVLGGSQGAQGLNTRVIEALPACRGLRFQVLHVAGEADCARVERAYAAGGLPGRVVAFLPDIGRAYSVADLLLARAGASTVAECALLGRPAVFVPYPWHKDRQQARNAEALERAGAARIVEERDLDGAALRRIVTELLLDGPRRGAMAAAAAARGRPGAARDMAAHLLESVGEALRQPAWTTELGE